jgi:hypothetical protein
MRRGVAIAAVSLGIGSALGFTIGRHERAPGTKAPSTAGPLLTDNERALLAPVTEGGKLGEFDVTEVHPIGEDGGLRLACRKEHAIVRLEIVRAAPESPPAPITEGPYAIYYSVQDASQADGEALAGSLAAILRANSSVRVPPRLAPFSVARR